MSDVAANRRVAGLAIESAAPRAWRATLAIIAYGLPVAFILLPLLAFLTYSFFYVAGVTMSYAPTLANYQRFFTDPVFLPVFWRTCLLCLEVAVLAVGFGYPVAFFLAGLEGRKKYTLLLLLHGAAADELCHQDLCHPQHPGRQRLSQPGAAGARASSISR